MRKNKITQHQGIFYQLYKSRGEDPEKYIPIWQLIGEVEIPELGQWVFISYEVSARMSELKKANPDLFQFIEVTGKTGAKYNAYRIKLNVSVEDIRDSELLAFYKRIKHK